MGCCGSKEEEEEREPLRSGRVFEAPNQNQISINSSESGPSYLPSGSGFLSTSASSTDWDSKAHFEEIIQETVSSLIDVTQNNPVGISSKESERRGYIYSDQTRKFFPPPHPEIFALPTASTDSLHALRSPVDRSNLTLITKTAEIISTNCKNLHVKDVGPFVVHFSYDPK